MESVLHIYRRDSLSLRAIPTLVEGPRALRTDRAYLARGASGHAWTWLGLAEAFQREQTESRKGLVPHLSVIVQALPFVFHGAHSHANPRIQFVEAFPGGKEGCGEVLRRSPNHSVDSDNDLSVEVVRTTGQLPDLILEFQH